MSTLENFAETNDPYLKSWNSFPTALRKDLNNLWRFIGPVSNLPNGSFLKLDGVNIKLSPTAQRLHLHLELKWGIIEILWRMYSVQGIKNLLIFNVVFAGRTLIYFKIYTSDCLIS